MLLLIRFEYHMDDFVLCAILQLVNIDQQSFYVNSEGKILGVSQKCFDSHFKSVIT